MGNLSGKDLSGINLSGVDFQDFNLEDCILEMTNLSQANLSRAKLNRANLRGANLAGANLSLAECKNCNFYLANLSGACLTGTDLTGANLIRADLKGANYYHAILSAAQLTEEDDNIFEVNVVRPSNLSKDQTSTLNIQIYPQHLSRSSKVICENSIKFILPRTKSFWLNEKFFIGIDSTVFDFGRRGHEFFVQLEGDDIKNLKFSLEPKKRCKAGLQDIQIYIKQSETNLLFVDETIQLHVDDYVFDHVTKPRLNGMISLISGLASAVMFVLTFLQQVDAAAGATAGTTALFFSYGIYPGRLDGGQNSNATNNP